MGWASQRATGRRAAATLKDGRWGHQAGWSRPKRQTTLQDSLKSPCKELPAPACSAIGSTLHLDVCWHRPRRRPAAAVGRRHQRA